MTIVGDKQILTTQTLLLGDDEVGKFDVPVDTGTQLPVTIRFLSRQQTEPTTDWRYAEGTLNIDCAGWNVAMGGGMKAHRIGDYNGRPIGFSLASYRVGTLNHVTLQFYLGGKYE
jgi:hypothetical protein